MSLKLIIEIATIAIVVILIEKILAQAGKGEYAFAVTLVGAIMVLLTIGKEFASFLKVLTQIFGVTV